LIFAGQSGWPPKSTHPAHRRLEWVIDEFKMRGGERQKIVQSANGFRGPRGANKTGQPVCLSLKDSAAQPREPVVTTPAVIHLRIRTLLRFLDQSVFEQATDGAIKPGPSRTVPPLLRATSCIIAYP